ncbi:hypothetical protein [Spirosoma sp.]|uniref:hypothetical protein n=1 Tax=Spirosoma sp. TaxID=1899569 RepID=UPI00261D0801|nr:hypothetical protein [Spirosoma sp.]MCX6218375.1 hypothetical protein [Spirosoma sp.]
MSQQQQLNFSPPKTLADYPLITKHYANMSDQWLPKWGDDMAKRVENPIGPWCKEFAHFHLEAINLEVEKRNLGYSKT